MSIRCVRGDQGSACPEGLGSASWRQKGPRRGSARWVWSDPVSQNGTPASAGSLPGTGDWAQNRAWRAGIMSFPLWTMDGRGIRRGWAECLPLASGRFCPFLGRKPGHSRCLESSATPRILLCRRISYANRQNHGRTESFREKDQGQFSMILSGHDSVVSGCAFASWRLCVNCCFLDHFPCNK